MLRTLLMAVFLGLYILLVGPPFVLHCILTGSSGLLYRVGVAGARFALRLGGVRIRAAGVENLPGGVCIFVANHTSNLDPPAVVAAIPRQVALMGKKEVFSIPILRHALLLAHFVPVDRRNRAAAVASLELATTHLKNGVSYLIFPEGTRSPDGRLRPFKKGTFVMAIKAAVPIVPVSVVGAQRLMGKGSWAVRPGEIAVQFHRAIDARAYSEQERDALMARVHAAVAAGLPAEQQPSEGG
jgi:1-acyl-sn-glycerol-3-phosphate acyltransferase